jgi:putative addiction module component (TIGR02574 family)
MSTTAFDRMTTDEQIAHVQDLWDRIAARPENIEVSEAWRQELARRSAELKANPDSAIPWEDVRAEIRARLGYDG